MPSAQVNTLHCLILQSRTAMKFVPPHFQIYFINSKRRFFLYFRYHSQMMETIRILTDNGVRFYRRQSLIPDRQELEEQVFHCGYRYKKVDLRRSLLPSTPYNEPKLLFDKYEQTKGKFEINRVETPRKNQILDEMHVAKEKVVNKEVEMFKGYKFKNSQVASILQNKQLLNSVLFSLNFQQ